MHPISLVFSPRWFYGIDIAFEIVVIVVSLLIARLSYRLYKVSKEKNHKYFAICFSLLALAFVFKILTNFTIYYHVFKTLNVGWLTVTAKAVKVSNVLFVSGFLLFRILSTLAFLGIFMITDKKRSYSSRALLLFIYFVLVITLFNTNAYYLYYLNTVAILLALLYNYAVSGSKRVFSAFLFVLFSQFTFMLVEIQHDFYVVGEILQLVGYFILLYCVTMLKRRGG